MKNKNILLFCLITILALNPLTTFASEDTVKANGNITTLVVNGKEHKVEAYNIDNNNYFKLRDLAFVLDETDKSFSIDWDEKSKTISLTSGEKYIKVGSELKLSQNIGKANAKKTNSNILFNGSKFAVNGYNIKFNNYFKLRDICSKLDIFVGYDNKTKSISIDSTKSYVEEDNNGTEAYDLSKYKKDIVNKKYSENNNILAITTADFDYNNEPYIVALVNNGNNGDEELLVLNKDGKLIRSTFPNFNFINKGIYRMYPMDYIDNGPMEKIIDIVLVEPGHCQTYRQSMNFQFDDDWYGQPTNFWIQLIDDNKIQVNTPSQKNKIVFDLSNNPKLKNIYKIGTLPIDSRSFRVDDYLSFDEVENTTSFYVKLIDSERYVEHNASKSSDKNYKLNNDFIEGRKQTYELIDIDLDVLIGTFEVIEILTYR